MVDWDRPASRTTTQPAGRRQRQESSWSSKQLVCYASLFPFCSFFPTQCDSEAAEPDLLHERSYRTCFEPDNPRRRTAAPGAHPPTPPRLPGGHHQPGNVDIPARPWWGDPGIQREPWWSVLPTTNTGWCCDVWLAFRMLNVIRKAAWPCPSWSLPLIRWICAVAHTVMTPVSATHADDAK